MLAIAIIQKEKNETNACMSLLKEMVQEVVFHARLLNHAENHVRNNSDEEILLINNTSSQASNDLYPSTHRPTPARELSIKVKK